MVLVSNSLYLRNYECNLVFSGPPPPAPVFDFHIKKHRFAGIRENGSCLQETILVLFKETVPVFVPCPVSRVSRPVSRPMSCVLCPISEDRHPWAKLGE